MLGDHVADADHRVRYAVVRHELYCPEPKVTAWLFSIAMPVEVGFFGRVAEMEGNREDEPRPPNAPVVAACKGE